MHAHTNATVQGLGLRLRHHLVLLPHIEVPLHLVQHTRSTLLCLGEPYPRRYLRCIEHIRPARGPEAMVALLVAAGLPSSNLDTTLWYAVPRPHSNSTANEAGGALGGLGGDEGGDGCVPIVMRSHSSPGLAPPFVSPVATRLQ